MYLGLNTLKITGRGRGVAGPPIAPFMELGVNLGAAGTSNAYYPFINVMLNSAAWQAKSTNVGTFTQNQGNLVASNPNDYFFIYISDGGDGLPQGRYTVKNPNGCRIGFGAFNEYTNPRFTFAEPDDDGAGYFTATSFGFNWPGAHATTSGLYLMVQGSCSGVEVIQPGYETAYNNGQMFTNEFFAYQNGLGALSPLRMMIWSGTNGNTEADWADRTTSAGMTHYKANERTVTHERIIQTANTLNRDLWVCVPYRASQDYVDNMAALYAANLNSNLRVYVEHGNELWNNFGPFGSASSWVTYQNHTRHVGTLVPATGVITKVGHGLVNDDILRVWSHRDDLMNEIGDDDGPSGVWRTTRGAWPMRVEVIDANSFKLWTLPLADPSKVAASWATNRTKVIYVLTTEAGKTADANANYGEVSLRNWTAFDTAFGGTSRVIAVLGSQAATPATTTARLEVPGVAARCDRVAIAPYYDGSWFAGQVDVSSNLIVPKIWTNSGVDQSGTATTYFGVYTQGSTPTIDEVKAGTGTGFVTKATPWETAYGRRLNEAVTISFASPAVVTFEKPAPPNGTIINLMTTGALPAPLLVESSPGSAKDYFVVNSSGNTCQLSLTSGGAAINTTDAGSGTHTLNTDEHLGSSYIRGTDCVVVDGNTYTTKMVVVDPYGYSWMMSNDIAVSASPTTPVDYFDTYANQAIRGTVALFGETSPWLTGQNNAIAASANPNIKLANYEGGSHWFNMPSQDPAPTNAYNWMLNSWAESQEYADALVRYLYHLAAKGVKTHGIFVDLTDGVISWTLANSITDTLDKRYLAHAALNGRVTIQSLLNLPDVVGTEFQTDPGTFPQTVATLDNAYTYTVIKGHEAGNYALSGNVLQMVADNGIAWNSPVNQTITLLASNGQLDDLFNVTSITGSSWYRGDEHFALDMTTQASTATLTPIRGNALNPVSTQGTLAGGYLTLSGASDYTSSTALTESLTVDGTVPFLMAAVVAQSGAVATSQRIIDIGVSQFCRLSTTATNANQVRWRIFGQGDVSLGAHAWSATPQVFWIFVDAPNQLVYYGRNQTVENVGGTAYTAGSNNTFGRTLTMKNTTANAKFGSVLVRRAAELNLTKALEAVQRMQTLHGL